MYTICIRGGGEGGETASRGHLFAPPTTTYLGRIAAATCWYTPTCFERFLP
jgi:hypothetical protein